MTHPVDLLSAYLDGELASGERTMVAAHLDDCRRCSEELDGLARVRGWIRGLPVEEPPVPLVPVLRRQSRWVWAAAASAAAAALVIGLAAAPDQPDVPDLDTLAGQHTARVIVDPGISTIRGTVAGP